MTLNQLTVLLKAKHAPIGEWGYSNDEEAAVNLLVERGLLEPCFVNDDEKPIGIYRHNHGNMLCPTTKGEDLIRDVFQFITQLEGK